MNPTCLILSGPSGVGKSTYTNALTTNQPAHLFAICSADNFFTKRGNGVYDFDPALLPEAHKESYLTFVDAVSIRVPLVIVDNTNLTGWEIAPYYTHAAAMGYMTKIIKFVRKPFANLHGVPDKAVQSMIARHGKGWAPHWLVQEVK